MRGTKSQKWTPKDVERLTGNKPDPHSRAVKLPKPDAKGLSYIKNWLKMEGISYVSEYKFNPDRDFKFDVAIICMDPFLKIAVEYEGLFSTKSRHTTVTGFTRDLTKYNSCTILGWSLLRYSALNYSDFPNDFRALTEKRRIFIEQNRTMR